MPEMRNPENTLTFRSATEFRPQLHLNLRAPHQKVSLKRPELRLLRVSFASTVDPNLGPVYPWGSARFDYPFSSSPAPAQSRQGMLTGSHRAEDHGVLPGWGEPRAPKLSHVVVVDVRWLMLVAPFPSGAPSKLPVGSSSHRGARPRRWCSSTTVRIPCTGAGSVQMAIRVSCSSP